MNLYELVNLFLNISFHIYVSVVMTNISCCSLTCCIQVCVSEEREGSGGELELGAWRHLAVAALATWDVYIALGILFRRREDGWNRSVYSLSTSN